jgi:hypothetical protein
MGRASYADPMKVKALNDRLNPIFDPIKQTTFEWVRDNTNRLPRDFKGNKMSLGVAHRLLSRKQFKRLLRYLHSHLTTPQVKLVNASYRKLRGLKLPKHKSRRKTQTKVYESINDMPTLRRSNGRSGNDTKKGPHGKTKRKGHGETVVNNQHNDDQNILVGIYGKKNVRVEEDFLDILVRSRVPEIIEYKPNVMLGDIDKALGKLWRARIEYKRKHNVTPKIRFMTRRKLVAPDIELFTLMGAKVSYLTKENKVVDAF